MGSGNGRDGNVLCPVCGNTIPLLAAADHAHSHSQEELASFVTGWMVADYATEMTNDG